MKRKPMTLPMDVLQNTLKSHKYVHAHLQFEIYICKTEKASVVYKKEISSMQCDPVLVGVQTLRNMKQLCNLQVKHLQQSRIFQDALYSIQLAYIIPSYIWIITTFPDLVCICELQELLDRVLLLDPHSQLLSYDTTFWLSDFYVLPLLFRHTLLPCVPASWKKVCGNTQRPIQRVCEANSSTEKGEVSPHNWQGEGNSQCCCLRSANSSCASLLEPYILGH